MLYSEFPLKVDLKASDFTHKAIDAETLSTPKENELFFAAIDFFEAREANCFYKK